MAYSTGTGATVVDLLAALRSFALGQGWSVVRWEQVAANNLEWFLGLSKGVCHIPIVSAPTATLTWYYLNGIPTTAQQSVTDPNLYYSLATSINPAIKTGYGHPGSFWTANTSGNRVRTNSLGGPYVAWHFFSGDTAAGDPDYIHVVVQVAADRYQHMSFGHLNKRGLSHGGVAYCEGSFHQWRPDATNPAVSTTAVYCQPVNQNPVFYSGQGSGLNINTMVYAPDALPTGWAQMRAGSAARMALVRTVNNPTPDWPNASQFLPPQLLSLLNVAITPQWSGRVTLFDIPCFVPNSGTAQLCYVGDYPGVRAVNMEGLKPGQTVSYDDGDWMIFPVMRQTSWDQTKNAQYLDNPTSGQYGVAYKRVM